MTTDQYVAMFSAAVSFLGLLLVVLQLREGTEQRKLESQIHIYDINRKLISLGFSHPELFDVLKDGKGIDAHPGTAISAIMAQPAFVDPLVERQSRFRRGVSEELRGGSPRHDGHVQHATPVGRRMENITRPRFRRRSTTSSARPGILIWLRLGIEHLACDFLENDARHFHKLLAGGARTIGRVRR